MFTRLINRISEINASEGKPAGRALTQAAEHFVSAIPASRVRSLSPQAAARLDFVPPPLSPDEISNANATAAHLGVGGMDEHDLLPPGMRGQNTDTSGGPSEEELEAMLPSRFRSSPASAPGNPAQERMGGVDLPSGRPMHEARGMFVSKGMPDFRKIQGFNLERGVAIVDGIEFPIPDEDVKDMKKFALHIVLDNMVVQVASALVEIGVPQEMADKAAQSLRDAAAAATPGAMTNERSSSREGVSTVSPVSTTDSVPQGRDAEDGSAQLVQTMHETDDQNTDASWLLADREAQGEEPPIQGDDSGSSDEPS